MVAKPQRPVLPDAAIVEALDSLGADPETLLSTEERQCLDQRGFVCLGQLLSREQVDEINRRLGRQLREEGASAGSEVHQEEGASRMSNMNNKRSLNWDGLMDTPLTHPKLLAAMRHVRGLAIEYSGRSVWGLGHVLSLAYALHYICRRLRRYCYLRLWDSQLDELFAYANGESWAVSEAELAKYPTAEPPVEIDLDSHAGTNVHLLHSRLSNETAPLVRVRIVNAAPSASSDALPWALPLLAPAASLGQPRVGALGPPEGELLGGRERGRGGGGGGGLLLFSFKLPPATTAAATSI